MVGVRRATALLILGFYITLFGLQAAFGPQILVACFVGLTLCYALAFYALAAEWFWGRWFAIGLGNFGAFFLLLLLREGLDAQLAFFGFSHLAIVILLLGEGMAARYEHSEHATERWNFQEESLVLMRRAVKSAGSTIPFLILWAFAPRPELFHLVAFSLAACGLIGLLRARTWGVLAMGGAGLMALVDALRLWNDPSAAQLILSPQGPQLEASSVALLAAATLLIPLCWGRAIVRYLRDR